MTFTLQNPKKVKVSKGKLKEKNYKMQEKTVE
jgi:hypothetical protein